MCMFWGQGDRQFWIEPLSRKEDPTIWQLWSLFHADSQSKRRPREKPRDDRRQMSQTSDALVCFFFKSFFYGRVVLRTIK